MYTDQARARLSVVDALLSDQFNFSIFVLSCRCLIPDERTEGRWERAERSSLGRRRVIFLLAVQRVFPVALVAVGAVRRGRRRLCRCSRSRSGRRLAVIEVSDVRRILSIALAAEGTAGQRGGGAHVRTLGCCLTESCAVAVGGGHGALRGRRGR